MKHQTPSMRADRLILGAGLGLALAALPAWAQSAAPATGAMAQTEPLLPLAFDAAAREVQAQARPGACALHIAPTLDERQNKQTIGVSMRGGLVTGDAGPWVTEGLMHLKDYGYSVQRADAAAPQAQGLLVKTSITRAYTWQVGLNLFGMIALKAQFVGPNGVVQDKYYRAHGDKTNMWGAASEYVTTLNYGLNNLLRVMADDLTELCKGGKVEPYSYAGPDPKPKGK